MLPLNLSDTAATSQDGSSLEFIAAIAGRQCYIQDASGRGLCALNCTVTDYIAIYYITQQCTLKCYSEIHKNANHY